MPIPVSYSRLAVYRQCPLRFKLAFLDKVPAPDALPLQVGRLAHDIMVRYLTWCLTQGKASDAEALAGITDDALLGQAPAMASEVREALAGVGQFTIEPAHTWMVEQELAFDRRWQPCDWMAKTVFFRAKIDLWYRRQDGGLVAIDHKSDQRIWSGEEVERDDQLPQYAYLLSLLHEEDEYEIRLHFTRWGALRTRRLARADLAEVRARIEAQAAQIDAEQKWEARLGDHCATCPYWHGCRTFQSALKLGSAPVIRSHEEAQEEAQRLLLLRKATREAESRLKAWAEVHGPIPINQSEELGYRPKPVQVFPDTEAVVQRLLQIGVMRQHIWEEISLSRAAVERMLKKSKLQSHLSAVVRLADEDIRTEFGRGKREGT